MGKREILHRLLPSPLKRGDLYINFFLSLYEFFQNYKDF